MAGVSRWSWELIRRTSAPARLAPDEVGAGEPALLDEPFAVWFGAKAVAPLTATEVTGLARFFALGGVVFIDDSAPQRGAFGRSVTEQLQRVAPQAALNPVASGHVLFKSFYLLDQAQGLRPPGTVSGLQRGGVSSGARPSLAAVRSGGDVLGTLAQNGDGSWALPLTTGVPRERELTVRFCVNVAMYVLCLDYKDDQVHAEALMRRRGMR